MRDFCCDCPGGWAPLNLQSVAIFFTLNLIALYPDSFRL